MVDQAINAKISTNVKTTPLGDDYIFGADPDNGNNALKEFGVTFTNSWGNFYKPLADALYVTRALFDANTILIALSDNTPVALNIPEQTLFGRITAGNPTALTPAQVRTLLNIEDGATADQSDSEIEAAYNAQVPQVSGGEITAGTETDVRRFSPADIVAIVAEHGSGGPGGGDLVDDTTPQLGGNLDLNGFTIPGVMHYGVGSEFDELSEKTDPLAIGDLIVIEDSEDSLDKKYIDFGQLVDDIFAAIAANGPPAVDIGGVELVGNATVLDFSGTDFAGNAPGGNEAEVSLHASRRPGKTMIPLLASAFTPNTTAGASAASFETATNDVMYSVFDFDQSTPEFIQFTLPMPKSWDEGTLTARFRWTTGGTGDVLWGIAMAAISNDDPLDAAFGTQRNVLDSVTAANDLMISDETSAITPGGTPAEGDLLVIRVSRVADNGTDTLAADARLIAVDLFLTTVAHNDA